MPRAAKQTGIYVERQIHAPLDRVWELTQTPQVHQRWDLRFTKITYLPRIEGEPQRFLYATRIGFGLAICGTGESVATRRDAAGDGISSLQFASDDALSLIREGSGYWRYIPAADGTRFLTWYDYRTRFGWLGRCVDRFVFQPLMGWATAWSFDRLALWAEQGTTPELSMTLAAVYALARTTIAGVWLWHGLIPKLLFRDADERRMLMESGVSPQLLTAVGAAEIAMALLVLLTWRWRGMFAVQAGLMVAGIVAVALRSPEYLTHAFNPVTLNALVCAMAAVGWMVAPYVPTARRCIRADPRADSWPEEAT